MSSDNDLTTDVSDELFWDPKVDSTAIAVSADNGRIALRGTVGSLREKHEAQKAAQRVLGVISVDNQLQVKPVDDAKRADADIRGDVLQALMLDSLVPTTVDAKVENGLVTSPAPPTGSTNATKPTSSRRTSSVRSTSTTRSSSSTRRAPAT